MKYFLSIILILRLTSGSILFAQCPINTLSTNPSNYQNSSDPAQQLKWDWRLPSWIGYRPGTPAPIILTLLLARFFFAISVTRQTDCFPQINSANLNWPMRFHYRPAMVTKGLKNIPKSNA
jgi:hypothetical protein